MPNVAPSRDYTTVCVMTTVEGGNENNDNLMLNGRVDCVRSSLISPKSSGFVNFHGQDSSERAIYAVYSLRAGGSREARWHHLTTPPPTCLFLCSVSCGEALARLLSTGLSAWCYRRPVATCSPMVPVALSSVGYSYLMEVSPRSVLHVHPGHGVATLYTTRSWNKGSYFATPRPIGY